MKLASHFDDEAELDAKIEQWIRAGEAEVQLFWDRWHSQPIEQYVACDFRLVARGLQWLIDNRLIEGTAFCEWGCGFGIITGIATLCGLDAIGIEAEPFLVEGAQRLLRKHRLKAEIWEGNFLPSDADELADPQARHASLFHDVPPVYASRPMQIDDFAIIFVYPWPGEQFFLMEVFRKYARSGAILLMFLGPYEMEVYRKA